MLALFAALAALFFVGERLWPRRPRPFPRRGWLVDAAYVPLNYLLRVGVNLVLADALSEAGRRMLPGGRGLVSSLPAWAQAVVVLVVLDFLFYVMHRLKHRWSWWWRLHETHHSSVELDFLAGVRFHPLEKLVDRLVFLIPLTFLGPGHAAIVAWSAVDVFFGLLNHSNVRWRIGPLSWLFVGPEMHRWHHARDPAGRLVNFGNNLSIFDRLFGTAWAAREDPPEFGIEEAAYPQDDLIGQWAFAFRRADASRPRAPAP